MKFLQIVLPLSLILVKISLARGTLPIAPTSYNRRFLAVVPSNQINRTVSKPKEKCKSSESKHTCINGVREYTPRSTSIPDVRGGAFDDIPDSDYDDYYDEHYDEEPDPLPQRRLPRRPPPSRYPPPSSQRRRSKNTGALGTAANLAKKTVDVTASAAVASIKGSGKAAFHLVSPKHVTRKEVWGVWRLDQQGELF